MRRIVPSQTIQSKRKGQGTLREHISVNEELLKATDYFIYMGSLLSREANIDVEVNNILSLLRPTTVLSPNIFIFSRIQFRKSKAENIRRSINT